MEPSRGLTKLRDATCMLSLSGSWPRIVPKSQAVTLATAAKGCLKGDDITWKVACEKRA